MCLSICLFVFRGAFLFIYLSTYLFSIFLSFVYLSILFSADLFPSNCLFSEPSSGLSICPIPAVPVHLSMHNLDSG